MSEVRLIDANALKEKFSNMYRDDYEKWIKAIIDNAPTITPEKALMNKLKGEEELPNNYRDSHSKYWDNIGRADEEKEK